MIRLTAVRLIHWYHFVDQTFRLNGSALLLGDNGSGKSTVLDAVQFGLVADQTQIRFNQAANEKSRRTLYGYVRYKLGSEDETRPGEVRYGRAACTAYIILGFTDDRSREGDFSCGIVMEAGEADREVSRWHFILPGLNVGEVPAVEEDLVRTLSAFRAALRERAAKLLYPDAGSYRAELRHRLGALPEAFHRLIVKGADFRPIGKVRDFVLHYLLDERPVDTFALQTNLDHYKQLEAQARDAERRISALDRICETGERIVQEKRTAESHRYLSMRGAAELAEEEVEKVHRDLQEAKNQLHQKEIERTRLEDQLRFLARERDRVMGLLLQLPGYQQISRLKLDLEENERLALEAADAEEHARRLLADQERILELLLSQEACDLRRVRPGLFTEDPLIGRPEMPEHVQRLREALRRDGALSGRDLKRWTDRLDQASSTLGLARLRLDEMLKEAKEEGRQLQAEQAQLEQGRQRYPDGVEALLHLLKSKLKGKREPKPLCELVEIGNPRWRDAVEGYLNTRRFDVIVSPEDFPRALGLYERNKAAYPLPGRGEVFISNVGLVDVEKMRAAVRPPERHALAEQVQTDDPLARVCIDFLLGEVICCDSEQTLRAHRRAITPTVMVYQNYTARQTAPEVYARHWIGQAARRRRLEEIAKRLALLSQMVIDLARELDWSARAAKACGEARTDAARLPGLIVQAQQRSDLQARAERLTRQLDRIDKKEIALLEEERREIEADQTALDLRGREIGQAIGGHKNEIQRLSDRKGEVETTWQSALRLLEEVFGPPEGELRRGYEERYRRERKERPPSIIRSVFDQQHRNIQSRVDNLVQQLVKLKTEYANAYGFPGEAIGEGYQEFSEERDRFRDSRLPDYREKIAGAKQKAIQQLAEDIIFRLRANLVDVRRQIDELNRALKDVPFGSERYQFTLDIEETHRNFYDLIMEAGRFERDSLFGEAALSGSGAREVLEELFDRLVSGEARQVKSELEARADYREYFKYDLKIHHADGSWSLYDKVSADKSGGETQNPYYIAIFASMYRLYRTHSPDGRPTCGLVLLDEAFSKMDEGRIAATLRFARALDLQLVMATPKERSELVAPWVETSLYIHRDPQSGMPTVLDFTKEWTPRVDQPGNAAAEDSPPTA